MSVLFKSPSNNNVSIGGSNKGFPPGDISNISYRVDNQKILIKWQDPDDTIIDGITLSKWKGTLLIRNNDHYPTSIKDGDVVIDNTIRNKYKDIFYEDIGLINDHMYYYRFFVYSEDNVYNDSSNLVFKDKPLSFAPILKDNTWEQIIAACESNSIPSTWKIGDEIDLTLSGEFNETVTMQIWDFNHFDKSDGSGKANICFGMKNLMSTEQQMNLSNTNIGGWNNTHIRNDVMINVFNCIPLELSSYIKEINTYANKGGQFFSSQICRDKVFLPGYKEIGFATENYDGNQYKFPIFTDRISRIKYINGQQRGNYWWTRSPYTENKQNFRYLDELGTDQYTHNYSTASMGICFCFNI